jgi:hypothetical protein
MNEPRGRPVAKPVTGGAKQTSYVQTTTTFRRRHLSVTSPAPTLGRGLNARAKPSPLLVLSPSSTGGQPPPPLLPPSSLRGHPIRWKTRPRKLPRGRGAGATTAAEDPPKLIRKKNAATTRSSLSPGPDEGRTSAQSSSSSCSSSSSTSSSSGARRRPRKPTDAEEEEEEGSVASRSVETTEDDLTHDSSFDKEDDNLTRGSSYSVDENDDDDDDDCTNNDITDYSRGSRDARSHGPRHGRGNFPAPIPKSRDNKTLVRGRRRSESDGVGGGRRRATFLGMWEDYYDDDGLSLDAVSPCCSSLCVIREGVNDLTRRWRRRAGRAPFAVDADDDIDDFSDEMRDAKVDSWEDFVSRLSERPASPPPDPPATLRSKRQAHKTKLV